MHLVNMASMRGLCKTDLLNAGLYKSGIVVMGRKTVKPVKTVKSS